MPSALWDVQDALYATLRAALTPSGVTVYNGPQPVAETARTLVLVGTDGDSDDDGATVEQSGSDLGPGLWRSETGEIVCAVWAKSGDPLPTMRGEAKTVLDLCEAAIRADRSLGGVLDLPGLAEITRMSKREQQTPQGSVVRVTFVVSYGALLTT